MIPVLILELIQNLFVFLFPFSTHIWEKKNKKNFQISFKTFSHWSLRNSIKMILFQKGTESILQR